MTAEQIASLSTILTLVAGGIGWMIKRQAVKRDEAEQAAVERDKAEQVERIAHAPALQQIVADQVQELLRTYAAQNERLLRENNEQRERHREERRSWEKERKQRDEEWAHQRQRLERVIDRLQGEIDELRRDPRLRTRVTDVEGENTDG